MHCQRDGNAKRWCENLVCRQAKLTSIITGKKFPLTAFGFLLSLSSEWKKKSIHWFRFTQKYQQEKKISINHIDCTKISILIIIAITSIINYIYVLPFQKSNWPHKKREKKTKIQIQIQPLIQKQWNENIINNKINSFYSVPCIKIPIHFHFTFSSTIDHICIHACDPKKIEKKKSHTYTYTLHSPSIVHPVSPSGGKIETKSKLMRQLGDTIDLSTFDYQTGRHQMHEMPSPSASSSSASSAAAAATASSNAKLLSGYLAGICQCPPHQMCTCSAKYGRGIASAGGNRAAAAASLRRLTQGNRGYLLGEKGAEMMAAAINRAPLDWREQAADGNALARGTSPSPSPSSAISSSSSPTPSIVSASMKPNPFEFR